MVTISTTGRTVSARAVVSRAVPAASVGAVAHPTSAAGSLAGIRVRIPQGVARIRGKRWLPLVVAPMFDYNRIGVSVPGREPPPRT